MSIATQITRLQGVKTDIRNALVEQGVEASTHNMNDFATDILNISGGGGEVPDGWTVEPINDVQIWLSCAGIKKDYTIISQVLADVNTLSSLITHSNSASYLYRSKNWINAMCADESAMTYIGLNDYLSNLMLDDSEWRLAICNSNYFEKIISASILPMTNNNDHGYLASGSSYFENMEQYNYYKAFDGNNSTAWVPRSRQGSTSYLQFMFDEPVSICKILIEVAGNIAADLADITQITVACGDTPNPSNIIGTYKPNEVAFTLNENVENVKAKYWKFTFTHPYSTQYTAIGTIQLYGRN